MQSKTIGERFQLKLKSQLYRGWRLDPQKDGTWVATNIAGKQKLTGVSVRSLRFSIDSTYSRPRRPRKHK